jgi:hypothetical protein
MAHSYTDVFKALSKKELTVEEKDLAVAQAEELFGARAPETRADIVSDLQAKPEPKKEAAKSESKSASKRKAASKGSK